MKNTPIFSLIFTLLALGTLLFGAIPQEPRDDVPYKVIHSDHFNMLKQDNGNYLTILTGNVHFFYGPTEFFADRAEVREAEQIARLVGHVKAIDDTLTLTAYWCEYNHNTNLLNLRGDVVFTETMPDSLTRTFSAREVTYNNNTRFLTATGQVNSHDQAQELYTQSEYAQYDVNKGYGYLTQEPRLWVEQTNYLQVTGQKIELFYNDKKALASFDVVATTEKEKATSDFLLYKMNERNAIFWGRPRFYSSQADAAAKEFHLHMGEKTLELAELRDSCQVDFAVAEGAQHLSRVTANSIDLELNQGALRECRAWGNVVSKVDNHATAKNQDAYFNTASGDSLTIEIGKKGKIMEISMRGKVSGSYKFYNKSKDKTDGDDN